MASNEYYLIGFSRPKLLASRNPLTLRKLLQNMVFENVENSVPLKDSVKLVTKNAMVLWKQSKIETMRVDHIEEKLEKEYLEWRRLNQNKHLKSEVHQGKCDAFIAKLDREFDVKTKRKAQVPLTTSSSPKSVQVATEKCAEDFSFEIEESETESQTAIGDTKKRRIETRARKQQTSQTRPHVEEIHESK